jgi:hypothetical protein
MDGKLYYCLGGILLIFSASIFAKADPLGNQVAQDIPTSAYDAAIREFLNRNGSLSECEEDD